MQTTHYLPIRGSYLYLVTELFRELGIDNGSRLYALPMKQDNPTVIFSPIPPDLWERAHKLVVYLSGEIGRLSAAAEVLSDMKINLITSAAAATTATGEVCWSSTVELPEDLQKEGATACEKEILERLEAGGALSRAREFQSGLKKVVLRPLEVLQSLRPLTDESARYVGTVDDFALDMRAFRDAHGNDLFRSIVIEPYIYSRLPAPNYCLITPDTEEKYFRLTVLPHRTRLMEATMELDVMSRTSNFQGFFGATLRCLSDLGFNIYAANNLLLSKTPNASESARFVFTVDASRTNLLREPSSIRPQVYRRVKSALEQHAAGLSETTIDLKSRLFKVKEIEQSFPRCFLATNADAESEEDRKFVQKLLATLRSLKLEPVNVDITKSRTVYDDVAALLRASALVVSLHLPTQATRIARPDLTLGEKDGTHNPSDWVLFEESFALALGRRIFRLRHQDVRQPRYAHGEREFSFAGDLGNFEHSLRSLELAIGAEKNSVRFLEAVAASEAAALKTPESLLRRNLEGEYRVVKDEPDAIFKWRFQLRHKDEPIDPRLPEKLRAVFLDGFGLKDGWGIDSIREVLRRCDVLGLLEDLRGEICGYALCTVPSVPFEGRWLLWEDAICLRKRAHAFGLSKEILPAVQRLYPGKSFGWIGGRTQNPVMMNRYAGYGKVYPFDLRYDQGLGPKLMDSLVRHVEEVGAVPVLDRSNGICRKVYQEGVLGDYAIGVGADQPFERQLTIWGFNRPEGDAVIMVAALQEAREEAEERFGPEQGVVEEVAVEQGA